MAAPRIPPAATNTWRHLVAVAIDAALAACPAYIASVIADGVQQQIYAISIAFFGVSFLNHVLVTRVYGASLGKFATHTRVITATDGSRPRLPRLVRRWLGGCLFAAWSLIDRWAKDEERDRTDDWRPNRPGPDLPKDFCGVRLVRLCDLRTAGSMQAK
ncbi:RDD family protein [Streptomyces sp. NBRC 110611]|uniref:RDD family protein n=1 Tax=Streptomyces sp. NBRC 110611 TaxID=1621259 RepID=UPI00215C14F3|nr:RDD family protein [Streptomyces sp. NBRC 110611]